MTEQERARYDRALTRARTEAEAGTMPRLLRQENTPAATFSRWSVTSRTDAARIYLVNSTADASGIRTRCTCQAADRAIVCWHRAAVWLAIMREIPSRDDRPARLDQSALTGRRRP